MEEQYDRPLTAADFARYKISEPAFIHVIKTKAFDLEILILQRWVDEGRHKAAWAKTAQAAALIDNIESKIFNEPFLSKAKEKDWEIMMAKWNAAHEAFANSLTFQKETTA